MEDVYVSSMGTLGQQSAALNALKHSAGIMRTRLTKALRTRITPFLRFHADEKLRKELDMLSLLDQVHKENEELDRKRAGITDNGQLTMDNGIPKEDNA